jgi:hypothetical protein
MNTIQVAISAGIGIWLTATVVVYVCIGTGSHLWRRAYIVLTRRDPGLCPAARIQNGYILACHLTEGHAQDIHYDRAAGQRWAPASGGHTRLGAGLRIAA